MHLDFNSIYIWTSYFPYIGNKNCSESEKELQTSMQTEKQITDSISNE